jgi:hypothetical protein
MASLFHAAVHGGIVSRIASRGYCGPPQKKRPFCWSERAFSLIEAHLWRVMGLPHSVPFYPYFYPLLEARPKLLNK